MTENIRISGRRLGRKPKPADDRDLKLAHYLTLTASTYPASVDWAEKVKDWGMLLNDRLGDCTIAGSLHAVQTWKANSGGNFTPTNSEALSLYEKVDGYNPADPTTDQGGVLRDVLGYWRRTGMAGHKVTAYVAVNPTNRAEMKAAIALFGAVYVGLELPISAQAQGVNWSKKSGLDAAAGGWGGHCVIYTGYTSRRVHTVTWGQTGTATWGFHNAYCDEAWASVSPDWMNKAGVSPTGLNLATLESDLAGLQA